MKIDCTIIVPIHNEAEGLACFFNSIIQECEKLDFVFELLFIDDGSTDQSLQIIKSFENKENIIISFISFAKNYGHQTALRSGYHYAAGTYVITMDGDNQHPPSEISKMIELAQQGSQVVVALRDGREQASLFKKLTSRVFYKLWSWLSGMTIETGSSDFRLITKDVLYFVNQHEEQFLFLRGLISNMGFKCDYIYYQTAPRKFGKTKFTLARMFQLSVNGIVWGSVKPLRFASALSLFSALLAACFGLYSLYVYFVLENSVPGWTSLMAIICLIGALQLLSIGILGEYISVILRETQKRPIYISKEKRSIKELKE